MHVGNNAYTRPEAVKAAESLMLVVPAVMPAPAAAESYNAAAIVGRSIVRPPVIAAIVAIARIRRVGVATTQQCRERERSKWH
jgi:hypothetical protein